MFFSRNSAAVAGNGAGAKRLLAGVQGMLGLARKDTSSGIVFVIFILCSVTITTQNYDTEASNLVSTDSIPIAHLFVCFI
ncbi:hypothetical protein BDR06DRAFT_724170 [Suillus hirtellus]|nr:hypothetical protein BDR06DRAFT_724170 [Suillus hirtellus]